MSKSKPPPPPPPRPVPIPGAPPARGSSSGSERHGFPTRGDSVADAIPTEDEGDALFDELFGDLIDDGPEDPAEHTPSFEADAALVDDDDDRETIQPPPPVEGDDGDDDLLFDEAVVEPTLGEAVLQGGGGPSGDELVDTNQLPRVQLPDAYDERVPYAEPYEVPPVQPVDEAEVLEFDDAVMGAPPVETPPLPDTTGGSGYPPSGPPPAPPSAHRDDDQDDQAATVAMDASEILAEVRAAGGTPLAGSVDLTEGVIIEEGGVDESELGEIEVDDGELEIETDDVQVDTAGMDEGLVFEEADLTGNDAVVTLVQSGQRDAWLDRATWLYREAPPASEAQKRANALLVVSELYAMAGAEEHADRVAREALQLTPSSPMAHRQLRGILMARGQYTEVVDALDAEARVAPSAPARFHAHYVASELARLAQGDPESAKRRLDQAERADESDVRLHLARLAYALGSDDEVPEIDVQGAHATAVSRALDVLRALRSDGVDAGDGVTSAYAGLLVARAALRRRDMAALVAALEQLEQHEEFAAGASWLIAALASADPKMRADAVAALGRVSEGSHGGHAIRARAARALEAGDNQVAVAVANDAPDDVLSVPERLVVSALAGTPLAEHVSWIARGAANEEVAPLAAASAALVGDLEQLSEIGLGDEDARQASLLGRQLAAGTASSSVAAASVVPFADDSVEELEPLDLEELGLDEGEPVEVEPVEVELGDDHAEDVAVAASRPPPLPPSGGLPEALVNAAAALAAADAGHGAARALLLEHFHASGQASRVVESLSGEGVMGMERERGLVAALVAEAAGEHERMAEELERAAGASPEDEAALRMAMVVADTTTAVTRLLRHAEAVDDSARAAIAFTEAGLRLMEEEGQEGEGEALLRRANETNDAIPIAAFIGMYIAAALGDTEGERMWLQRRRETAGTPEIGAADTIRLALRMGADETAERASFLDEAHRARPDDYTLRDLYEMSSGVAADRASWLVERLEAGSGGATMALEAALAFEMDGDLEQAARAVHRALEAGESRIAPVFAQRHARSGFGAGPIVERLESQLRRATEPNERVELALAIAQIEARGRGDHARAAEVLASVLDQGADNLTLLHALQSASMPDGERLADVALAVAKALDGAEAVAQATLAARLYRAQNAADAVYDAVGVAFAQPERSLWVTRTMASEARARGDHATAADVLSSLAESATRPLDQGTLFLRAAESAKAAGQEEVAAEVLGSALDATPRHPVALLERAAQLELAGDVPGAARAHEELAMATADPQQRAAKLYKAASAWLSLAEGAGNDEGRRLLEAVSAIDPDYLDTFERLQAIYLAMGAKRELADLLGARLDGVTDPDQRMELEVLRGRMLVEAGSAGEARDALAAALEANPDNPEALTAYADVCAAEGDYDAVEQSIVRLGRLVSEPEQQIDIYLRLGALYADHKPNPERAEKAYLEVLKRAPEHQRARDALVRLYLDSGDTAKAFEQQQALIDGATSHAEKCTQTVRMAEIHEAAGELKEAEQILVKARRAWSKEPAPVLALYRFYKRTGQEPAADMLLDRAAAEVRRGLGAGRFEAPLFALAKMVAEMRDQTDAALIADATLAAIEGRQARLGGAGVRAGIPDLDEHTAPDIFIAPFREMLATTGQLMDLAAPFDVDSVRAKPLPPPHQDVLERTLEIAAGYGLPNIQVLATNALGRVVIPAGMDPPTIVFGLGLVTADDAEVRDFMIHRAVKVLQTRTAALARTAPIDLWPLVAAYLKLHSPSFEPAGVDGAKVTAFHDAMAPHAPKFGPQMSLLASEVISNIGNRASSLNTQSNAWGSRCALIALGDPNVALEAIAWASGSSSGPPSSGPERVRWIGRQAEARDLIVFSVSDGYAAARTVLGIEGVVPPPDEDDDDELEFDEAEVAEPESMEAESIEAASIEPESIEPESLDAADFIDVDMDDD